MKLYIITGAYKALSKIKSCRLSGFAETLSLARLLKEMSVVVNTAAEEQRKIVMSHGLTSENGTTFTGDPEAKAAAVKEIESMLNQDIDFPVEKIKIHIPENAPELTVEEMMFALEFLEVID